MSEYIPTTEEVRDGFSSQSGFDRWLAQNNAEVAKATEERIIALLERNYGCDLFQVTGLEVEPCDSPHWVDTKLEDLIALIKGEQDNSCEPKDLPCVNGFSCEKHAMSFEDATRFIKGEQE